MALSYPPSQGAGAIRSTVTPPWHFESSLSQIPVPGSGVLTLGSGPGCDVDSQFHKVSSSELACMNTTSEVTRVVFKTGSKSACMQTTSEVKNAVSVVHRLSEGISDSSSNSGGDGDVDPPLVEGDVVTMEEMDGSKSWEKFYNLCPLWGYLFLEKQDPDAEWPRGLRWEMGR